MTTIKNKLIFIFACILFHSIHICNAKEIPIRLDLHIAGGVAYPWTYISDIFNFTVLIDIDGRALIKKSAVKSKIPKKFRKFIGDEMYVGHILIPNTFAFSLNRKIHSWDVYVDWNLIGITLFKVPKKGNHSAPINFNFKASIIAAYHLLKLHKHNSVYLHSVRPGIQARGDFYMRLAKHLSLKLFILQNGYIPDKRGIKGTERNIMPNYSGGGIGFVIHLFTKRKI